MKWIKRIFAKQIKYEYKRIKSETWFAELDSYGQLGFKVILKEHYLGEECYLLMREVSD